MVILKRDGRKYYPIKSGKNQFLSYNRFKTLVGIDVTDPSLSFVSIFYFEKDGTVKRVVKHRVVSYDNPPQLLDRIADAILESEK